MTEEHKRRIEELGLIERKKSSIEETLDILESLQAEGIDVTQIKRNIKEDGKSRSTYLYEIEDKNIEEIIERLGIDREYRIGRRIANAIQVYRGKLKLSITETDKKRIEALGLVSELEKKEAEQNRLKKKQRETKKLKAEIKQELDKQNDNKDLGDSDE